MSTSSAKYTNTNSEIHQKEYPASALLSHMVRTNDANHSNLYDVIGRSLACENVDKGEQTKQTYRHREVDICMKMLMLLDVAEFWKMKFTPKT